MCEQCALLLLASDCNTTQRRTYACQEKSTRRTCGHEQVAGRLGQHTEPQQGSGESTRTPCRCGRKANSYSPHVAYIAAALTVLSLKDDDRPTRTPQAPNEAPAGAPVRPGAGMRSRAACAAAAAADTGARTRTGTRARRGRTHTTHTPRGARERRAPERALSGCPCPHRGRTYTMQIPHKAGVVSNRARAQ
jgi:hypothetical protein